MALSDAQIERYSRQIIVPGIGGVAQQRMLAAKMIVAGDLGDVEPVLAYLVGAGVGTIAFEPAGDVAAAPRDALIAEMRRLNPDATVLGKVATVTHPDLVAILIGSRAAAELAARLADTYAGARFVVARLDGAGALALLGAPPPPCPRCADGGALLRPFGSRASTGGFITLLAAAEALKLLAGSARPGRSLIVEFDSYRTGAHPLRAGVRRCACSRKTGARQAADNQHK